MDEKFPMLKDAYEQGRAMVKQLWGAQTEEIFDVLASGPDTFNLDTEAWAFGYIFQRPPLDLRIRALINVGIMTALDRRSILRTWIVGALNAGCASDEVREAIIQASLYAGLPPTHAGLIMLKEVLEERESSGQQTQLHDIYSIYYGHSGCKYYSGPDTSRDDAESDR